MAKFAIFVTVKINDGKIEDFLAHAYANATAAVRDEPNCHMFRVMQAQDDANTVHFYEVYTDESCLDEHRETVHYKAYNAATADMISDKNVQKLTVLQ